MRVYNESLGSREFLTMEDPSTLTAQEKEHIVGLQAEYKALPHSEKLQYRLDRAQEIFEARGIQNNEYAKSAVWRVSALNLRPTHR